MRLARSYDYVGVEVDEVSAKIAAKRVADTGRGKIVVGEPDEIAGTFDAVCAFEVLEHIEDDHQALIGWREKVRPGGWLILSVPAWRDRWGAHDERAGHFRRYEPEGLLSVLDEAGFSNIRVLAYGFPLLSALHPWWNRLSARGGEEVTLDARTRASGRFRQPPSWLAPATQMVAAPFALVQRRFVNSRRGTGLIAFAQRTT
jgi:SAM-dependent methyltransferase